MSCAAPALAAETIRVTIDKLKFTPTQVSAHVGDTIEWVSSDFVAHTATARNKDWDVAIPANGTGHITLQHAGDAIPLMTMTSARVSYLYDLMDAAYDAAAIHDQSRALGHAPIVDRNFRADHEGKAEWGREVERLKLIHMPDFDDLIYDFRTMAERVNARLKDEFGARFLRVRGALKVKCHLMFGIVALAVDQIIRVVNYRTAPA